MRGLVAIVPVILLASLSGCSKTPSYKEYSDQAVRVNMLKPPPPAAADVAAATDAAAPAPVAAAPDAKPKPAAVMAPSAPLLAYAYAYTLSLPADRIAPTLNRDQQACVSAGPTTCQLVGSSLDREGRSVANGHLELRAAPAWIAHYRGGVESEAKTAGGRVETSSLESEDLTRSIVDTEAEIRAKTTLRDRIQKLLAERPGKLSDVLDAERELARVQGELDATQSELAVMRTRVETSKLVIDYHAEGVAAPDGVDRPLQSAANGFFHNMIVVFAAILTLVSFLLPLALVGAPIVVGIVYLVRKRRAPRPGATAAPAKPDDKAD